MPPADRRLPAHRAARSAISRPRSRNSPPAHSSASRASCSASSIPATPRSRIAFTCAANLRPLTPVGGRLSHCQIPPPHRWPAWDELSTEPALAALHELLAASAATSTSSPCSASSKLLTTCAARHRRNPRALRRASHVMAPARPAPVARPQVEDRPPPRPIHAGDFFRQENGDFSRRLPAPAAPSKRCCLVSSLARRRDASARSQITRASQRPTISRRAGKFPRSRPERVGKSQVDQGGCQTVRSPRRGSDRSPKHHPGILLHGINRIGRLQFPATVNPFSRPHRT